LHSRLFFVCNNVCILEGRKIKISLHLYHCYQLLRNCYGKSQFKRLPISVESYTIIVSLQSYTYCHTYYYWYSITHSLFHSRLKSPFSANPPYRSLSFFSFRIHYMDFPDCLLLLLSISVFLFFYFFLFCTFLVVGSVRWI